MDRSDEASVIVGELWEEQVAAQCPAALRGVELAGIDLVMLDADIAGCVSTWQNRGGSLDADRQRILRGCLSDLDRVALLLVQPDEIQSYQRRRRLAVLTTESGPVPTN
ncbi:hypothetical protein [Streptomyces sp. Rer75]|uniref:hypothetical protein n=1 Tax=Streptomyces sp. Rer75 TaxID=2750011 RepID=UPI0015CFE8D8|nr:hypothetical protein [Streptomyces sp. Rer75]QLH20696.1 hypothetical protein HYQ63_08790 [Streptomyces sp. Rer75]